ncbi:hypothetical protein D3C72_1905220 [compost metagenome]
MTGGLKVLERSLFGLGRQARVAAHHRVAGLERLVEQVPLHEAQHVDRALLLGLEGHVAQPAEEGRRRTRERHVAVRLAHPPGEHLLEGGGGGEDLGDVLEREHMTDLLLRG